MFVFRNPLVANQFKQNFIQPVKPSTKPVFNRPYERHIDNWGAVYEKALEKPTVKMSSDAFSNGTRQHLDEEEKWLHLVDGEVGKDGRSAGEKSKPYTITTDVAFYSVYGTDLDTKIMVEELVTEFVEVSEELLLDENIYLYGLLQELVMASKRKHTTNVAKLLEQVEYAGVEELIKDVIGNALAMERITEMYEIA